MAKKASAAAAQPWSDPGLKCLLTLSWLLREKGHRALHAAMKKHVGDEDMYVSEAMEAFLVAYPLGEAELATFESIGTYEDWTPDLLMKLIPQFDGEDEPFLIARWDDLVRLPSVSRVACQREGAIPSPELVSKLPGLQSVKISTTGESGKQNQKSTPKFEASGFFVADIDFKATSTQPSAASHADIETEATQLVTFRGS